MKKTLTIISIIFMFHLAIGQVNEHKFEFSHTIKSSVFETDREVLVSLPQAYYEDTTTTFAVLYLFDAQFEAYQKAVSAMLGFYAQTDMGIPMIVVGIKSANRFYEFTPTPLNSNHEKKIRKKKGSAEMLTKFLKEEVIPLIEGNYRNGTYRLGVGHSLGGTYLFSEIMNPKPLFNGIIAISPNLVYNNEQLIDIGKSYFVRDLEKVAFIYTSSGDVGSMELRFNKALHKMDSVAQANPNDKILWNIEWLEKEGHISTFIPSFNIGIRKFFDNFIISEIALQNMLEDSIVSIDNHIAGFYNRLSDFTSQKQLPSASYLNKLAYDILYLDQAHKSLDILNYAISLYPNDYNLYDSKADMLENIGKYSDAKASYLQSQQVLLATKDNYSEKKFNKVLKRNKSIIKRLTDDYVAYKTLIYKAKVKLEEENYKASSDLFSQAFEYNIMRATHNDRRISIEAFAQNGDFDKAFAQLKLLAKHFEWRGRKYFDNDKLMSPLKADPRWEKYMQIMESN
jgi:predicted alpha/beta superfamily hydrolase/ElaB/YqjD/DUF883 family membrane-anchored ribosome-binding protein